MPTPEQHAVLSASSSARWLNCTASARLAEKCPRQDTAYTTAGTLAHTLAELKARKYFCGPMSQKDYRAELAVIQKDPAYDKGMDSATDLYLDHLKELTMAYDGRPFVALESRVDYSDWAPEGFGTADCVLVNDDELIIVDYKNGTGVPVSAAGNPQLRLYALGAMKRFSVLYDFDCVTYYIVQPHLNSVSHEMCDCELLELWAQNTVRPAAELAYEGKGEFVPGEHCRFCAAKAVCAARAAEALKVFDYGLAGSGELSDQQIADILPRLPLAEEWIKDIRSYTEDRALHGDSIRGYKLVRGKRPNRAWTDDEEVRAQLLRHGYDPEQFEETKLKSVGVIEKTVGTKAFRALLSGLVRQGEGRLQLVPESDPSPEYNSADAAFSDMAETNNDI